MRIKCTNEVLKAIAEMQNASDLNAKIGYQLMQHVYRDIVFPKPEGLRGDAPIFQKYMRENGFYVSVDEAMMGIALYSIISAVVDDIDESIPLGVFFQIMQNSKIFKESDCKEFGRVLIEKGDDSLTQSTERLQHFAGISSDTWGFC